MTSFELHPAAVTRLVHSSDLGAESSFPERHFSPHPDEKSLPGVELGSKSTAVKTQTLEPSDASSWSQGWSGRNQTLHHRNLTPPHGPLVDGTIFSPPLFPTTAATQNEWELFRKQSPSESFWKPTQPEFIQDDSDSNQSPNDDPEDLSAAWPSVQKPRRRSVHRVVKPTRPPGPERTHYIAAPSNRSSVLDFDHNNTDWLDFSDPTVPFVPQPNCDNATTDRGEPELIFETASRSSKAASKRIAHKLSEKTRRNRLTIAIREIQKLLPTDEDGGPQSRPHQEGDFVFRPGVPSSKLDVVEMAVGFIKDLKAKNAEMTRRVREAERRLEECRCQGATADTLEDAAG